MNKIRIINGNMLEVLPTLPQTSIAAAVTDPPYEISFMSRKWDSTGIAFQKETWKAVERVLYPGGFLLAFGGTRTAHRMAVAIEDAGFTINNFIGWVYGSGFPKAQDITKQIDKVPHSKKRTEIKKYLQVAIDACKKTKKQINEECGFSACSYTRISGRDDDGWGNALPTVEKWKKMKEVIGLDDRYDDVIIKIEREVIGKGNAGFLEDNKVFELDKEGYGNYDVTSAGLPEAKQWSGWKTPQLKPAIEPIFCCIKDKGFSEPRVIIDAGEQLCLLLAKLEKMDMSKSQEMVSTLLNTASLWKSLLEGNYLQENKSIIKIISEMTIELRTLNSLIYASTPKFTTQESNMIGGLKLFVTIVEKLSQERKLSKKHIQNAIAQENAMLLQEENKSLVKNVEQNLLQSIVEKQLFVVINAITLIEKEMQSILTEKRKSQIEPIYVAQKQLDTADSDLKPLDPFIYNQKCSSKERNIGCDKLPSVTCKVTNFTGLERDNGTMRNVPVVKNNHPCLKPKKLLSYLMRLVAPSNSTILDPFMGSGSGALGAIDENMSYIGIEMDKSYFEIAEKRIDGYFKKLKATPKKTIGDKVIEWEY